MFDDDELIWAYSLVWIIGNCDSEVLAVTEQIIVVKDVFLIPFKYFKNRLDIFISQFPL